jgi:hypothetical protein
MASENLYSIEWFINPVMTEGESYVVRNNKVLLDYIPSPVQGVLIDGLYENKYGQAADSTEKFVVNYNSGEITFHSSKEGHNCVLIAMSY